MQTRLKGRWLTWNELEPFTEQLIELEIELTHKFHYPNRDIPRSFAIEKVKELENHLKNGNTFFWAIIDGECLLGYNWAYISMFIDKKRWNIRSLMFRECIRGQGYANESMEAGILKAKEMGCSESASEYATWNNAVAALYERFGYIPSRIEVVKNL